MDRRKLIMAGGSGLSLLGLAACGSQSKTANAQDSKDLKTLGLSTPVNTGATNSGAPYFARTPAEVAAGVTPVDYGYMYGDVRRYGGYGVYGVDYTQAINDAIKAIQGDPSNLQGGIVHFPFGHWMISSTIHLPPSVGFKGQGHDMSSIEASPNFSGQIMFEASNPIWNSKTQMYDYKAMFGSRFEDMCLSANDNPNVYAVIHARGWQESCGLTRVLVWRFKNRGVIIDHGDGGASSLKFQDVQIWSSDSGAKIGIECGADPYPIGSTGGFLFCLDNVTISGGINKDTGAQNLLDQAVYAKGVAVMANCIHFELCQVGILLTGYSPVNVLRGLTGGYPDFNAVGAVVALESKWTGGLVMEGIHPHGASYTFLNQTAANFPNVKTPVLHQVIQVGAYQW